MTRDALPDLLRDDCGTSTVEFGMICAFIVLAMFTALSEFADENDRTWNTVAEKVRASTQKAEEN